MYEADGGRARPGHPRLLAAERLGRQDMGTNGAERVPTADGVSQGFSSFAAVSRLL